VTTCKQINVTDVQQYTVDPFIGRNWNISAKDAKIFVLPLTEGATIRSELRPETNKSTFGIPKALKYLRRVVKFVPRSDPLLRQSCTLFGLRIEDYRHL
jgi:hypothetical protein